VQGRPLDGAQPVFVFLNEEDLREIREEGKPKAAALPEEQSFRRKGHHPWG